MEQKLHELITSANSIFVTSHISPDGDAVSSSLLLFQLIRTNHPDKTVTVTLEEEPHGLEFLIGYDQINFQPLAGALKKISPDLLVILDANALYRLTRDPAAAQKYLDTHQLKTVVIDHHEGNEFADPDIYINNKSPAVTLDIYDIFINRLGYKKPEGYANTALTGIYTDTGGFIHNLDAQQTFQVVPKLIADGADIETVARNLSIISESGLKILGELISNTVFETDHMYTHISDSTANPANSKALLEATDIFRDHLLRQVRGRTWGFIVQRDVAAPDGHTYAVSFRALSGTKDVSKIAAQLGGGGHKPAAGARITAESVEQALEAVKTVVGSLNK